MKYILTSLLILFLVGCASPTPEPVVVTQIIKQQVTATPEPATATHTLAPPTATEIPPTATITPTPTLDPNGDPDGDGVTTYIEQVRGTDPFNFESFEDLSVWPGTVYFRINISRPFDIAHLDDGGPLDLNSTVYQQVRVVEFFGKGTPNNPSDDHVELEGVIFPDAQHPFEVIAGDILSPQNKEAMNFPIDPSIYPDEVLPFLEPGEVTNITQEMQQTMLIVVKGSRTAYGAVNNIFSWNHYNLGLYDPPKRGFFWYREIHEIKAGDMFHDKKTYLSTTRATILAAELRAVGIPTQIISNFYSHPENTEAFAAGSHSQNLVYLNGHWVKLDYNFGLDYDNEESGGINDYQSYRHLFTAQRIHDQTDLDLKEHIRVKDDLNADYPSNWHRWMQLYNVLDFRNN